MGDKSPIQWTEATWNPLAAFDRDTGKRGWFCTKVSDGCTHCYAEKLNVRLGNGHLYRVGNLSKIEWRLVNIDQPIRWKRPRMIFVNSMTDLFHQDVPDDYIAQVFAVMQLASHHTFQVLTKRTLRMRDLLTSDEFVRAIDDYRATVQPDCRDFVWPIPNVHIGTSVEHQVAADERVPLLLQTPAAIRFLSCEPLLGAVNLTPWIISGSDECPEGDPDCEAPDDGEWHDHSACEPCGLHWVIVGGESGLGARPFRLSWARSLIAQCKESGTAVFVKQLGANIHCRNDNGFDGDTPSAWPDGIDPDRVTGDFSYQGGDVRVQVRDTKGGDVREWPEDLRVREMPTV